MKATDRCPHNGSSKTISSKKYAPRWLRCPECGRRLKPRFYDCHYNIPEAEPCWHYSVPPHKKKKWFKKGKKK